MNLIFFKNMSNLAVVVFMTFNLCFSLPVPQTLYSGFLAELKNKQCTLPSSISISNSSNKTAESSLHVCDSNEYIKFNKEVAILCTGIFDLFKSIFCPVNSRLDNVEFTFSPDVCKDLKGYANVMPNSPLKHLFNDSVTCSYLCTEEVEEACQVLWSSLSLTQMKSSNIIKDQLPSENTADSTKKENTPGNNDPKLQTLTVKQILTSDKPLSKQTDPAVPKNTNEKTLESDVNPGITQNDNNQESNMSPDNLNTISEVEKYSVSKAIADQLPVTSNNTFVTSANSTNLKTSTAAVPQNVNSATPNLKQPQNQPSDHSNTPNTEAKNTQTAVIPEQNPNPETNGQQKEKVQEETPQELPKKDTEQPAVPKENPDEDDTNLQTVPTTEVKKEETEVVHTSAEKPTNPKSDQLVEVSESSLSSEPSVVSVPAPKDPMVSPASPTPSLEKMEDEIPMPNEKDTDQYTDLENGDGDLDGEYSKQEYGDNGMYEPSKSKEPVSESPKSVVVPKEPVVSERDELMDFNRNPLNPSRDAYGRGSEEIQVLATFPSQEDGHFFFYLLTIVLISMAGYLVFHNKQKIIALIVEGRHERRRRSHGLGYRKLETK